MARGGHRHRTYLFLAAVLLPSAVLVGTTLQVIRQERELSERRWEEEKSFLALSLGQELVADLRELDEELAGVPLSPPDIHRFADSQPAIVAVALRRDAKLTFPWEIRPNPDSGVDPSTLDRYHRFLREGEKAEFREGRFGGAAESYGQAAQVFGEGSGLQSEAHEPLPGSVLRAEALRNRARALLRANQPDEARGAFEQLAALPPTLTDSEGFPFSIYALFGLHRLVEDPGTLIPHLATILEARQHLSSLALLAWRDVADSIASSTQEEPYWDSLPGARDSIAHRLGTIQTLEDLREDFPAVLATARANGEMGMEELESVWIPYGEEPWLVGIRGSPGTKTTPLVVVRPSVFLEAADGYGEGLPEAAQAAQLLPASEEGGEALGRGLNGLRASFPPDFPPPPEGGTVEGWFYRLLLPVILILTGFTAYLAWRDVRRETEAVRLRSQFVSSVTHELKTPLTSIRMFAETLRLGRHSGPEAQQEYLDTVVHEAERLSRLINNVLDFARIDRGEKTYHLGPTDLGAAVREATTAVAYPLSQGGYTLTADIAEDLPWVEADSDALTQALLNLLSNAIKFSGEGSEIGLRVFEEEGKVHFQVTDQGRGIAASDQEAIFQDFYRTPEAEEEGIPGTGLGLPLVAHVAEAHGGSVGVESEAGRGSTFTIWIPVGETP